MVFNGSDRIGVTITSTTTQTCSRANWRAHRFFHALLPSSSPMHACKHLYLMNNKSCPIRLLQSLEESWRYHASPDWIGTAWYIHTEAVLRDVCVAFDVCPCWWQVFGEDT